MKCIQIKFILPINKPLEFCGEKVISLKLPEQDVDFNVNITENGIYKLYTLKSKPLNTKIQDSTIENIKNSLYLSSIDVQSGILINPNLASGGISNTFKETLNKIGIKRESNFVGIKLVDCETKFISASGALTVGINSSFFENSINTKIKEYSLVDEKLLRAIELYNSISYLSRVNNSARFILLMSAIECIIIQKEIDERAIHILDNAEKEIKNLSLNKTEKDSILNSIEFAKKKSINKSGKATVQELFLNSSIEYNGFNPVVFFSKAYDLRSRLVHDGITKTKFLNIENSQLQQFTIDCLSRYYKNFCQQ
ncbi:hypothetical protein [Pontimicrobium sp. SW4]|uniref:Apea-like HEPN domain-containing protein n=1 Tax=Pontimicrobium sp. SW4 TaxID=3153519 RepID=A0AAU7BTG5_9FLAO